MTVAPSDLRVGDVVVVRPGGSVPADGEITDGAADMNESMVTGESVPVRRGVGEKSRRGHRRNRLRPARPDLRGG